MTRLINQPRRRRAFTLLELLVAVSIIAILSALLVVGITHLSTNARRQQTRSALEQARSLFADYDTVSHLHFAPSNMPCPQNMTADLSPVPSTPTQADDATPVNRYGAAVWFTRDVMFNLRSTPANAAALGKMSPGGLLTFPATYNAASTTTFPKPYDANVKLWNGATAYQPFGGTLSQSASDYGRVYLQDSLNTNLYVYYDCIQATLAGTALNPAADPTHWLPAYPVIDSSGTVKPDDTVPLLLDAWGNPILFVAGGTLGVTPSSANLNADGTVKPGTGGMASGSGTSAIATHVQSPDGRPFFASAGPDGDFSKGDDNLYSFEK